MKETRVDDGKDDDLLRWTPYATPCWPCLRTSSSAASCAQQLQQRTNLTSRPT